MSQIKSISIPQACHQSWEQMTPVNDGRHCQSCCKTVADFTTMSNNEIIAYLSSNTNTCGRFGEQQLSSINNQFAIETLPASGKLKKWVVALGLIGTIPYFKASAQVKQATVQTVPSAPVVCDKPLLGKIYMPQHQTKEIMGCVTDEINAPFPGVTIRVPSTNIVVTTDANGNFRLIVPQSTLYFNVICIGYKPQTIKIDTVQHKYQIKLDSISELMGDIVIVKTVKQGFLKRTYNRCIRRPMHKLFKRNHA